MASMAATRSDAAADTAVRNSERARDHPSSCPATFDRFLASAVRRSHARYVASEASPRRAKCSSKVARLPGEASTSGALSKLDTSARAACSASSTSLTCNCTLASSDPTLRSAIRFTSHIWHCSSSVASKAPRGPTKSSDPVVFCRRDMNALAKLSVGLLSSGHDSGTGMACSQSAARNFGDRAAWSMANSSARLRRKTWWKVRFSGRAVEELGSACDGYLRNEVKLSVHLCNTSAAGPGLVSFLASSSNLA
mmetsp:Transcript_1925/g.5419  ORF Transcript_1925/g.5419 Transcript_1925/m.5419 type:complete len:252 (+) Transcript_1925:242-997(+)